MVSKSRFSLIKLACSVAPLKIEIQTIANIDGRIKL